MKTYTLMLGLAACLAMMGTGVAIAQDSEMPSEKRGSGKLKAMDTDGDGQISLDEFLARAETRFGKMDADADGYVSAEELKDGRKAVRAKSRGRRAQE